ncbi:CAP domain-containing protein [Bacillus sp. FJAT-50079]|nr:CAP domain-containing protein [Bacillus sp. FJAT-50079]
MVISTIVFLISIYYYSESDDQQLLQDDNYAKPPKYDINNENDLDSVDPTVQLEEGLATYIGQSTDQLIHVYGEPIRKDPSAYGYEWWIYYDYANTYMQVGVQDGYVVTIYALGSKLNVAPFQIGQTIEEIYRTTLLETEITVASVKGTYRFELSEEDLNIRPLVQLDDIYAQLIIDKYSGSLSSIRFFDKDTLIKQRPYELYYRGDFQAPMTPDEEMWKEIERGSANQIFDISNVIRQRFDLQPLEWNEQVAEVAYKHSMDMALNSFFAHESPEYGDLASRLEAEEIEFQQAGENIAADYADGPAAVDGWLNSESHRKSLLEKEFTELGVGVYKKYYTQNFLTSKDD